MPHYCPTIALLSHLAVRVALDSIVASVLPHFIATYGTPDIGHPPQSAGAPNPLNQPLQHTFDDIDMLAVSVFNAFDPPVEIAARLGHLRPDVIVVDTAWLPISSLLHRVVAESKVPGVRCVIGSLQVTDVLKIQSVHHGMHDVVNCNDTSEHIGRRLLEIHAGDSRTGRDQ